MTKENIRAEFPLINNEKIVSVDSAENLKQRFHKIYIADGDILMINGEKVDI